MSYPMNRKQIEYNRIYKEFDDVYHNLAVENGLSDSAFTIFYTLCELGDGCSQKEICAAAYTSKQTIHSSVRRLEQEGILRLEPGKGRDKHIYLTEKGKALVEEKMYPFIKAEDEVFRQMTEQEGEELLRLERKYLTILQKNLQENRDK